MLKLSEFYLNAVQYDLVFLVNLTHFMFLWVVMVHCLVRVIQRAHGWSVFLILGMEFLVVMKTFFCLELIAVKIVQQLQNASDI